MAVTRHPAAQARTRRASESAPPDTAQVTAVPGEGKVVLGRRWAEELTGAHDRQELGDRAHAELATDAAEAGVDVRPAHAPGGGGLAHGVAAFEGTEQFELLGRQLVEPVAHRADLVVVGLGRWDVLEPGDVGGDGRRVVGAPAGAGGRGLLLEPRQLGKGLLLHLAALERFGLALEGCG